jgi:hypothetical protein
MRLRWLRQNIFAAGVNVARTPKRRGCDDIGQSPDVSRVRTCGQRYPFCYLFASTGKGHQGKHYSETTDKPLLEYNFIHLALKFILAHNIVYYGTVVKIEAFPRVFQLRHVRHVVGFACLTLSKFIGLSRTALSILQGSQKKLLSKIFTTT